MKLFAEIVATSLLPGVRAMLALELTGKYNLTQAKAAEKLRWLRARLAADWQAGRIDPIDEITNFHIMVIPPADKNPN